MRRQWKSLPALFTETFLDISVVYLLCLHNSMTVTFQSSWCFFNYKRSETVENTLKYKLTWVFYILRIVDFHFSMDNFRDISFTQQSKLTHYEICTHWSVVQRWEYSRLTHHRSLWTQSSPSQESGQ